MESAQRAGLHRKIWAIADNDIDALRASIDEIVRELESHE